MHDRLPRSAILSFAIGSLGSGVYSTVPTVLLLFYCTEILRIPPGVAATIVFVPKAWAIVWDPFVGAWSDRRRAPGGRRAPFILAGTLGVAVTFALLFNAPAATGTLTAAYMMLVYFVMASAYSLFAVPYVAIPAEITDVAPEREQLMAWRMGMAMVGVLLGAGIAPFLVSLGGGGRRGYGVMALLIAVICGLAMLRTWFMVRRYHIRDAGPPSTTVTLRSGLRRVVANRDYVRLWLAYLVAMSGTGLTTALVPYFVTHVLHRPESDTGTALLALLGATIVSIPLWSRALRRWGGWRPLVVSILMYAAVAACFALVPPTLAFGAIVAIFFLLGIPFAGLQLLPFTLLAHLAHAEAATGARQEGLYTGIWTAGEKLALALGPAMAGGGLALTGYVSGATDQTLESLRGVQLLMALGPALLMVLSTVFLVGRRVPVAPSPEAS